MREEKVRLFDLYKISTDKDIWLVDWMVGANGNETEKLEIKLKWLRKKPRKDKDGNIKEELNINYAKSVPICEIMGRYGYKKEYESNSTIKYCCPFHNEKTPSFTVYKDKNHAYCFGCNKSADSIDIVMHMDKCDFKEAVKKLSI